MNDKTAERIESKDIFPDGANVATSCDDYKCPCGKGKIVEERVPGFDDYSIWIDCEECRKIYRVRTGCGSIWELVKK